MAKINNSLKVRRGINGASHDAIIDTMYNLKRYWNNDKWMSLKKFYKGDSLKNIKNPLSRLEKKHIIEYITASVLHHCFDGWSYLGRAIEAELAGNSVATRHLGYFAELRGAMSILAHEGIGVFLYKHVVVHNSKECKLLSGMGGTHEFAREALRSLATLNRSHVLLRVVRLYGRPLDDWLSNFPSGSPNSVANNLLSDWSVDIQKQFKLDQTARNIASYRPSTFELNALQPADDVIKFLTRLWEILQPNTDGGFHLLDQQLLRYNIEKAFRSTNPNADSDKYDSEVSQMIDNIALPNATRDRLLDILKLDAPQPFLLEHALDKSRLDQIDYSQKLLARATLILRIATGCVEMLLSEIGSDRKDILEFWWSNPMVRRRLWAEDNYPDDFHYLWDDIRDAIDNIEHWLGLNAAPTCYHDIWKEHASDLSTLSTTERICLWGIGL